MSAEDRVSAALTEVRTVRSRALSALDRLEYLEKSGYPTWRGEPRDPDHDEIREALYDVVERLEPFKKRGKK